MSGELFASPRLTSRLLPSPARRHRWVNHHPREVEQLVRPPPGARLGPSPRLEPRQAGPQHVRRRARRAPRATGVHASQTREEIAPEGRLAAAATPDEGRRYQLHYATWAGSAAAAPERHADGRGREGGEDGGGDGAGGCISKGPSRLGGHRSGIGSARTRVPFTPTLASVGMGGIGRSASVSRLALGHFRSELGMQEGDRW